MLHLGNIKFCTLILVLIGLHLCTYAVLLFYHWSNKFYPFNLGNYIAPFVYM